MGSTTVYLLALTANLFFSSASMVFSIYSRRFSPAWINQFKIAVALVCFIIAAFVIGFTPITPNAIGLLVLSGVIGLCIGDMLLFKAFATLGAARSLLLFSFQPLLLGIYGWFFLGQGISVGQLSAVGCMVACLLVFVFERNRQIGQWDFKSFSWAFAGIFLDAVGVMLTRSAYEMTPEIGSMQVNVIRTLGALAAFLVINPKSYFGIWQDFVVMRKREKSMLIISCICGTFVSLSLYLTALKYAHVASLTAVAITGPVWVSILECLWERKLPNKYLIVAFLFFLAGFYLMT